MIRPLILLCLACAPSAVLAQSAAGATGPQSATGLNLAVPSEPLRYLNDPSFQQDAPGTYYGDKSGPAHVPAAITASPRSPMTSCAFREVSAPASAIPKVTATATTTRRR